MAVNYVKFYRGTQLDYDNLLVKNSDTLYFITDSNSKEGALYLGEKLISSAISSVSDLTDILINELDAGDLLVYNSENKKWENKSVYDAIGIMTGANADEQGNSGLVPAPGIGQQDLFLRGDGTWAAPEVSDSGVDWIPDGHTIEIIERPDGQKTLSLKDFSKGYYAYTEDGYVYTTDGFKEGLEARVVIVDGSYYLAWYEPNPTSVDDIGALVAALQKDIDNLEANTYTKVEIDNKIANAAHLKRKVVDSVDQIDLSAADADQYIYMVLASDAYLDDKYDEYMVFDGAIEKVGSWEVDLSDYVKRTEIQSALNKLDTIEEGAEKNVINSVSNEFEIDSNRKLKLVSIPSTLDLSTNNSFKNLKDTVVNMDTLLNGEGEENPGLISRVSKLEVYNTGVGNLDALIRASGVENSTLIDEVNFINERLQWHNIT